MFALIINDKIHELFEEKPELHPDMDVRLVRDTNAAVGWIAKPDGSFSAPPRYVAPFSADTVKSECERRIYAVIKDSAQRNLVAAASLGLLEPGEKETADIAFEWIKAMIAACRALIARNGRSFAKDSEWPAVPPGVKELADRY